MIAKRVGGKIILLTFCTVFHEISARPWNGDMKDKFGRLWSTMLDEQTMLKCYYCNTDRVFPSNPVKEAGIKYV